MKQGTTLGQLQKKLHKLERKFTATPEAAVIKRERIMKSAQAVESDINKLKKTLSLEGGGIK